MDGQVIFSQTSLIMIHISLQIAWTTAAVAAVSGTRVIGAMPIVLDMINLQQVRKNIRVK